MMRSFKPFNVQNLEPFRNALATQGRLMITKHLPMDLHLKKTEKLKLTRDAGVLVSLCNVDREPSLLYTVRSSKLRSHAGHVSFPGGGLDSGESYEDAALRETYEEIGVDPEKIHILGLCQTVYSVTGLLVTPVIGFLQEDVGSVDFDAQKSIEEVETVFSVPLTRFANDTDFTSSEVLTRKEQSAQFPVYGANADSTRNQFTIWGLTATITESVLASLFRHYPHDGRN